MRLLPNPLPSLHIRPFRPIKHKQRQEGGVHESTAAEEKGTEFGVLAFFPVGCMEEPDGGVDAYAEAASGGVEAVLEGEGGEGTGAGSGAEDLGGC